MELKRIRSADRNGYQILVDDCDPTSVFIQDMDGNLMKFDAGNHEYHDLYDQVAVAFEHRDEWEEVVLAEFACPECGERRIDYLLNDEGHITCESCGYEYDIEHLTFTVKNPWSGEMVEISESEVTQEKLDFLATVMDDEIRER